MARQRKLILGPDPISQPLLRQLEQIRIEETRAKSFDELVHAAVVHYVYLVNTMNLGLNARLLPILSELPNGEPMPRRFTHQERAKWGKVISLLPYLEREGDLSQNT